MRNAILLMALFCAACSNYSANLPSIKPYKMDIQQGNVVTSKMMLQLRPGMTRSQVRFIMGTPLIADSFHANRWDYVYRMQKDGKVIEQRRVILEFEDDQLKRVRGDVVPAGSGEPAPAEAKAKPAAEPAKSVAAPREKEKGLLDKLKFWKGDEQKAAPQPEPKPQPKAEPKLVPAKVEEAKPAPAPQPAEEPSAAQQPEAAPAPVQETKPMPAAEVAPKPAVKPEPAKPAEQPKAELKPVPKPADELPPEEDASYFERMLEKIGF